MPAEPDTDAAAIVVEHLAGSRRGQRQILDSDRRLRFGRHPACEISFDAVRDLDASSRHAELRPGGPHWVLVDLGSANGTFVDGQRITELRVTVDRPLIVEFGSGGPRLRLYIGDPAAAAALPAVPGPGTARRWLWLLLGLAVVVAAAIAVTC